MFPISAKDAVPFYPRDFDMGAAKRQQEAAEKALSDFVRARDRGAEPSDEERAKHEQLERVRVAAAKWLELVIANIAGTGGEPPRYLIGVPTLFRREEFYRS